MLKRDEKSQKSNVCHAKDRIKEYPLLHGKHLYENKLNASSKCVQIILYENQSLINVLKMYLFK